MYNNSYSNITSTSNKINPNYVPPSLQKTGVTGTWEGYKIQKVSLDPGDVLLCHISANMDVYSCRSILDELQKAFPDNTVMLCNEHVLKGMTIIKPTEKVSEIVDIASGIDVDALFDSIMKGHPNDFLH